MSGWVVPQRVRQLGPWRVYPSPTWWIVNPAPPVPGSSDRTKGE